VSESLSELPEFFFARSRFPSFFLSGGAGGEKVRDFDWWPSSIMDQAGIRMMAEKNKHILFCYFQFDLEYIAHC